MAKKFYITTAIPYVNASPHLGHALEFVQVDAAARYHRLVGEVFFATGSDENALKNVQAAQKRNMTTQQLCDQVTQEFKKFARRLNIQYDVWRRGSDKKRHWPGVHRLWQLCQKSGDIYKKSYQGLYCVGCEAFLTPKDLQNGQCPYHLKKPELIEEINYFFRLSKYEDKIKHLIESNELKVFPKKRKNEILAFINQGLKDFSVSRSTQRTHGWGIPVPGDDSQMIYVWYDALTIYMTAVGWGYDQKRWKGFWPADLHVIGKDIVRFHAVYWPAMLLSAGLALPKAILVHGFITSGGQKMAKSLGNVVDPQEIAKKYGADALRYYLLKEIPTQDDGDFTVKHFEEIYNADLANGLGNLVQRVAKLAEDYKIYNNYKLYKNYKIYNKFFSEYRFNDCLVWLWEKIASVDKYLDQTQPWNKKGKERVKILVKPVKEIREIAFLLQPFLPETAVAIEKIFSADKIKAPGKPLFPRLPVGRQG